MIDSNESYIAYVNALKELEGIGSKEEFNSLGYCLTLSKLNDHPNYKGWNKQMGRLTAFENLFTNQFFFKFERESKAELESNLEDLLKYSYGMMQKKKAAEILEKQFGNNINLNDYIQKTVRKNHDEIGANIATLSHSMMCLGIDSKDDMFKGDPHYQSNRHNSTFKDRIDMKQSHKNSKNTPILMQYSNGSRNKSVKNMRLYEDSNISVKYNLCILDNDEKLEEDSIQYPEQYKPDKQSIAMFDGHNFLEHTSSNQNLNSRLQNHQVDNMIASRLHAKHTEEDINVEEEEEEEDNEDFLYNQMPSNNIPHLNDNYVPVSNQQNEALIEEFKSSKEFKNMEYLSDDVDSPNKYRIISEMESEPGLLDYNITGLAQKGILTDKLPIRSGCFNSEYMAIGTNSKSLKICDLSNIIEQIEAGDTKAFKQQDHDEVPELENIPVIFDQLNHHDGSIYCIDWTECERLIATGSNDK